MDNLKVETLVLKPEYEAANRLWEKFFKRFFRVIAWLLWRNRPLVHYPLVIDIELGNMQYQYMYFGFKKTLIRINRFNVILVARMDNKGVDLSRKRFYVTEVLTDPEEIEEQLNKELRSVNLN